MATSGWWILKMEASFGILSFRRSPRLGRVKLPVEVAGASARVRVLVD
jgi:hypothetical protein